MVSRLKPYWLITLIGLCLMLGLGLFVGTSVLFALTLIIVENKFSQSLDTLIEQFAQGLMTSIYLMMVMEIAMTAAISVSRGWIPAVVWLSGRMAVWQGN